MVTSCVKNCLIQQVTGGNIEGTRRRERRSNSNLMILGKEKILEFERGNARWTSLENSLWKRLWTCETWLPILREHTFQIFENTLFDHITNEDILQEMR